jgi:transcription initiation factor IIE alpha subunit
VPWCEDCAKYWAPTAMNADGTCPTCGRDVDASAVRTKELVDDEKSPWHFKLLVVALVLYLGWRVVDIFI